uniref:Uncharacterized protein n=1 Tax=Leersia perrieri TaxID=77586 RepID=A0A0D9X031_9ORYZ
MTVEEKSEASCIRVKNPPLCHCGYPCKLQRPNIGVPAKFTPFFRCKLTTHDGWPMCDFQEYIHGLKSLWPTDEEEGRTCNWEDFPGRRKLWQQLGSESEPLRSNTMDKIRRKLRSKYDIPLPEREVEAMLSEDMRRHKGQPGRGYYTYEECITYWRLHRDKYPAGLTREEKTAKRQKIEEERERQRRRSKEKARKDPISDYPYGTWEHYFKTVENRERKGKEEEMKARARDAEMETVRALVAGLPAQLPVDKKGKGIAKPNWYDGGDDDWRGDEFIYDGDSN